MVWLTRANQASVEMRSEEPGASDGMSRAQNTRSRKRPEEPGASESDQSPELRSALLPSNKKLFLFLSRSSQQTKLSSFSSRSAALILGSPFLSFSLVPSVQAWPSLIGCPTAISLAPLRLAERGSMPVFGAKSKMPMPQRNPAWHIGLRPRTCRHARRPWRRCEEVR